MLIFALAQRLIALVGEIAMNLVVIARKSRINQDLLAMATLL
jgi:hypothetical protein